jgi:hypothetical protein
MPTGSGEFRITFDNDAQVPAAIAANTVVVQASLLTNVAEIFPGQPCEVTDPGPDDVNHSTAGANQVVPLNQAPAFDVDPADPTRKVVIIKVPDMNPATGIGSCGAGAQGIAAGAKVIITFSTPAGVKNRSEASNASDFDIQACSSTCTAGVNLVFGSVGGAPVRANVVIKEKLLLSAIDGQRGSSLTVIGKGFKDNTTATVWLDGGVDLNNDGLINSATSTVTETVIDKDACGSINGTAETAAAGAGDGDKLDTCTGVAETSLRQDNVRSPGEADLASVVVGSDDTFTATFTVNNPPFRPGRVNFIAAKDGRNNLLNSVTDIPLFELLGAVSVTPTSVKLGDLVTIDLKDFDAGCNLVFGICAGYGSAPNFMLGGVALDKTKFTGNTTTTSVGAATFTAIVPNGVPVGTQALEVRNACCVGGGGFPQTRRFNLTVNGATLILTPATVVPNQTLDIVGNDFTRGGGITINEAAIVSPCTVLSSMTIQGVAIARSKINENNIIVVALDGSWSASIVFPVNTTTTTPGTYDFKVTDCMGREGVTKLTIPARSLAVNPPQSPPGATVEVTGKGYPAANDSTGAVAINVTVKYDAGPTGGVTTIFVQPDTSGNIAGTLKVPTRAPVPSTSTVSTEFDTEAPVSRVVNTITHNVVAPLPSADLSLTKTDSPDPVAPGALLTYNLVVTNAATGSATATGVFVTETPRPPGVTFWSATPSQGSYNSGTGVWTVGTVGTAGSATMELKVMVGAAVPSGTVLTNTAVVKADQPDPNPANNTAVAQTTVKLVDTTPPTCRTVDAFVDGQGRQIVRFLFEDAGSGLARVDLTRAVNADVRDVRFPEGPADPMVMTLRQRDPAAGPMDLRFRLTDRQGNRVATSCRTFPNVPEPTDAGEEPTD